MTPATPTPSQDGSAVVTTTQSNTHVQINISINSNGENTPSVSISKYSELSNQRTLQKADHRQVADTLQVARIPLPLPDGVRKESTVNRK